MESSGDEFEVEECYDDTPSRKPEQKDQGVHRKGYDRIQAAIDRRVAIRKIMKEKGFVGITELKRLLLSDYNIDVGDRHTLYQDLANIEAITDEDLRPFKNKMIARCEDYLKELEEISEKSEGIWKAKMIRMYLVSVKDVAKILALIREDRSVSEQIQNDNQPKKKVSDLRVVFDDD